MTKLETGRLQFGEEAPGIFITSQDAQAFAMALSNLGKGLPSGRVLKVLEELFGQAMILESDKKIQHLRPVPECRR